MVKILDLFGKKDASEEVGKAMPYRISTEFIPYRLYANRKSSVMMMLKIKNLTKEPVLSSMIIDVPKTLSLDEMGLVTAKELRVGTLLAGEEKEQRVQLYGDVGTDKGEYTLSVTAFIHYRDYGHVLNALKKKAIVEVV